eukprot:TRINITY_DN35665_c0_g1_i3.p1 TRINITY_DN35665_c0_g1~~TRINITY_DN35665_c0_g1_i3.p1  ORF type:complete len:344 (-),score=33.26 TRINITY_DN35665_c0_g1_i3:307-1338(-)
MSTAATATADNSSLVQSSGEERKQGPSEALQYVADKSEHNPGIFTEACFVNRRGLQLRAYTAAKDATPRGVVVLHHGIRGHALYELLCAEAPGGRQTCVEGSVADFLLESGFAVYAYDCEGHGLSQGLGSRAFFGDVWDFVDDLLHFTELVRKEHPTKQVFALGFSMGGGIAVGAAIKKPDAFDGIVLAGPMVSVEKVKQRGANAVLVPLGPSLLSLCPCLRRVKAVAFPKNPDENAQRTWEKDPLTESSDKLMLGPSFECMTYCQDLVKRLRELRTPFLTMHAQCDTFVDFESSELLIECASSTDKTLLEPPEGSHHALFNDEASREWTRETAKAWLCQRCT